MLCTKKVAFILDEWKVHSYAMIPSLSPPQSLPIFIPFMRNQIQDTHSMLETKTLDIIVIYYELSNINFDYM